jgi:hypothetical protein
MANRAKNIKTITIKVIKIAAHLVTYTMAYSRDGRQFQFEARDPHSVETVSKLKEGSRYAIEQRVKRGAGTTWVDASTLDLNVTF